MNVAKMAWRNVWRNKRRSGVTIAAMTLALWVLLLYAGLIPGFVKAMEDSVVQLEVGDVQIHAPGYLDAPSLYTAIQDSDRVVQQLEEKGIAASPRLLGGGLAASGEFSAGVALRGLDVERDAKVSRLSEVVAQGQWLDPADPKGVVVGKRLARTLGAGVGSELIVVSQAADGSMANDLFRIRGILGSVSQGTDRAGVYMNAGAFRELMSFPEGDHQIVLRRGDMALGAVADTAKAIAPDLDVQTWQQLMPMVAQMAQSVNGIVYVFYMIVYIAVGILILNAMLTAVFERIREFGVLKAIGSGPLHVLQLILAEGMVQAGVATVLGLVLASPFMWYIGTTGIDASALGGIDTGGIALSEIWVGVYDAQSMAGPLVLLWVISMGAVLYPALKAAWINPITAMRHR